MGFKRPCFWGVGVEDGKSSAELLSKHLVFSGNMKASISVSVFGRKSLCEDQGRSIMCISRHSIVVCKVQFLLSFMLATSRYTDF